MLLYQWDYFEHWLFDLSLMDEDILYFGFLPDVDPKWGDPKILFLWNILHPKETVHKVE